MNIEGGTIPWGSTIYSKIPIYTPELKTVSICYVPSIALDASRGFQWRDSGGFLDEDRAGYEKIPSAQYPLMKEYGLSYRGLHVMI